MLDQNPEISATLDWMLQSRQVGDVILVNNLVQEHFSFIFRFVSVVSPALDFERCLYLAEQIILEVVLDTQGYQGEGEVQTWLTSKSVTYLRKHQDLAENLQGDIGGRKFNPGGKEKSAIIQASYRNLSLEERVAACLLFLFEFEPASIVYVLGTNEKLLEQLLADAKNNLLKDAGIYFPGRITAAEIQEALVVFCQETILEEAVLDRIVQRILMQLHTQTQRKRHKMIAGEVILAALAIIIVIGLGRLTDWFTPQPTPEIVFVHQTRMVNQVKLVTPTPGPTQPPRPFPEKAIIYEAVGGETLEDVAEMIYFNAQILSALNNLPTDQPLEIGQQIMIGISESLVILPTIPVADSTTREPEPTPEALTENSDADTILQRIANSRTNWDTLWADALVIQYGPPGYIGEPDLRRQQIWVDQPYFQYLLDGENNGQVEYAYSVVGGMENLLQLKTGDQLSNSGPQQLNFRPGLEETLLNDEFVDGFSGEIVVIETDRVAGRQVLVLDWYSEKGSLRGSGYDAPQDNMLLGRYWVDIYLGSILRMQKFMGSTDNQLFRETIISKILFDIPIPRRLYDRSQNLQTYFAKDHNGDFVHDPINVPADRVIQEQEKPAVKYQSLPENYDLPNSFLEFYWTSLERFNAEVGTRVDLFADGYYLGNINFGDPDQLVCARSPDGALLAFSSWSSSLQYGFPVLGWVNLTRLADDHNFDPELVPYDFAFSNDSRQLAVYACDRTTDKTCGIYLVDVHSGETHLLRKVEQGNGLIWSPDDTAVAIQGSFLKEGKWRLLVFDTRTGVNLFDGPFDWEGFWVAHDSPMHEWGVQYPPLRGGLEVCAPPPADN
jgi:hypothetical protein